jgi:hypothetical protein
MTYLKVRSHDADTPARWLGSMVGTTVVFGSDTTVPFGAPSIDDLGLGSGAQLVTPAGVTGWYTILIGVVPDIANVEHYDYKLLIGGVQQKAASRSFNTNGTTTSGDNGSQLHFWSGTIGPSTAIQFRASSSAASHNLNSAGANSVEITYVPVPNHRYA